MTNIAILPTNDHAHRWLIDAPNGPTSIGRCKVCRAERSFRNWIEEIDFLNDRPGADRTTSAVPVATGALLRGVAA